MEKEEEEGRALNDSCFKGLEMCNYLRVRKEPEIKERARHWRGSGNV